MVLLLTIRTAIAIWKRAIAVSDRLSPATWILLACCSALLFTHSYLTITSGNEIRVYQKTGAISITVPPSVEAMQKSKLRKPLELITLQSGSAPKANTNSSVRIHGSRDRSFNFSLAPRPQLPDFDRYLKRLPTIAPQIAPPKPSDFKADLLFWLSLFGIIISPITSVATITFAWISLHRKRAEAILMSLEIQKRELEIEQLRIELERARREYEESNASSPKIILLS